MRRTICALLAFAGAAVGAFGATWTDPDTEIVWTYSIDSGRARIGGATLKDELAIAATTVGEISIPPTFDGHTLVEIGNGAFRDCRDITSVTIPDTITSIKNNAFAGCSGLVGVTIGNGVTNIADGVFTGCGSLMSFSVGDGNPSFKAVDGLLLSKSGQALIQGVNGDVTIPDSVTIIEEEAFSGYTGLVGVTIPDSVATIRSKAFYGCSGLESIAMGCGATSISSDAFNECTSVRNVTVPGKQCSIPFANVTNLVISSGTETIVEGAFSGCAGIAGVTMPDSLTTIAKSAFRDCRGLTSVTIPASVTTIGEMAFRDCSGLAGVTLPESLTTIEKQAFKGCKGLTSVTIHDAVTTISDGAFDGCAGLVSVTIGDGVTYIGNSVFAGCNSIADVRIPQYVCSRKMGDLFSEASMSTITNITVGQGVSIIGDSAFSGCTGLKGVSLPDGISHICASAFADCNALGAITIPSTVTMIDKGAFNSCSSLMSVRFEGDAPDVEDEIFRGTPRRMTVEVPRGSVGWDGGLSTELPTSWSNRGVVFAGEGGSGGSSSGEGTETTGGASSSVTLTVTNIVMHYIAPGTPSETVTPPLDTGFVCVVAEVAAGGTVAIPPAWAEQFGDAFAKQFGSDFSAALTKETGKRDAAGNPMRVWQDFVAGTDPTDPDDVFTASITFDADGKPLIAWSPLLSDEEAAKRVYRKFGKVHLCDDDWTPIDGDEERWNFFKVTVEMK